MWEDKRIKAGSVQSRAQMTFCESAAGSRANVAVKTSRRQRHIATCRRGPKGSAALFARIYKCSNKQLWQDPSEPSENIGCNLMLKKSCLQKEKQNSSGSTNARASAAYIPKSTKGLHERVLRSWRVQVYYLTQVCLVSGRISFIVVLHKGFACLQTLCL